MTAVSAAQRSHRLIFCSATQSLGALLEGTVGLPTNLVPVRGYAKRGDAENVEVIGIAA